MANETSRWMRAQDSARRNIGRGRILVKLFYDRPIGRATRRYLQSNGNVLAGGVAYYSLASIAAALLLAVTVASIVVIGNDNFREHLLDFIGTAIPGIFPSEDSPGLVDPDALQPTAMSGIVGLIALAVLIYTATRYMRGMRAATRTMLGDASAKSLPGTLRDSIALFSLGLVAVLGAAVQVIASFLVEQVADWIGGESFTTASVRAVAALASFAADAAFVAIVFVVLGSARAPARVLVTTILLTGAVIAVIQFGSTYFVDAASSNPVLAPFAAVIALLLFVDLTARSMLIAAAWIGVTAGGGVPAGPVLELPSPARRSSKSVTTRRARGRD